MIALLEEGVPEEIRDLLLLTWDTYDLVKVIRKYGAVVQDWSLRRGWARIEANWIGAKNLDVIINGKQVSRTAFELDPDELGDAIRRESMEYLHFLDHVDLRAPAATGSYTLTMFFKIPITDDPKHPAYFQLPRKVAKAQQRILEPESLQDRLVLSPLCIPDIVPSILRPGEYKRLITLANEVFKKL